MNTSMRGCAPGAPPVSGHSTKWRPAASLLRELGVISHEESAARTRWHSAERVGQVLSRNEVLGGHASREEVQRERYASLYGLPTEKVVAVGASLAGRLCAGDWWA